MLGLCEGASMQEIKSAYRRLALRYHPDKSMSDGQSEKFKIITEAYGILRSCHGSSLASGHWSGAGTVATPARASFWTDLKIERIFREELGCYSRYAGKVLGCLGRYEQDMWRQCERTVGHATSKIIPSIVGRCANGTISLTK